MKKIFAIVMALLLGFFLAACGQVKPPNGDNKPKTVYLQYADWNRTEENLALLEAFGKKYPHIKVTWTEIGGHGNEFTGNLIAAAQQDALPDVFAIDNVPTVIANGLTLDVSKYWNADEDAKLVYKNIANTAVYGGKRYAIPSFQFLKGVFVNLTMFENLNLATVEGKYRIDESGYPVKDWTHMEMVELAKTVTSYTLDNKATFRIGLGTWFGGLDFQQLWPMMNQTGLGYDTFDGTKFDFNNEHWIEAMKVSVDLLNTTKYPGVTSNLPEEAADMAAEIGWALATGYQAMGIDGSWNFQAVNEAKENGHQLGFWPYPAGSKSQNPPTILDYTVVSSQTRYPEEAYLLAKWMSYGKDGWNTRMDIYEKSREEQIKDALSITHLDRWPIADYDGIWERIKALMVDDKGEEYIPGLRDSLDNIHNGMPDLDKWLAGYKDFWGWVANEENQYRLANLIDQGPDAVPQFAVEWNKKINELYSAGVEFGDLEPPADPETTP